MRPEQELAIRQFYMEVVNDPNLFPSNPVDRKRLSSICLGLLGYTIVDNKHVSIEIARKMTFKLGEAPDVIDEWEADTRSVEDEVRSRQSASDSKDKAHSSKSSKNTPLWKTLLSKDV